METLKTTAAAVAAFLGEPLQGPDIDIYHAVPAGSPKANSITFLKKSNPEWADRINRNGPLLVLVTGELGLGLDRCTLISVPNPRLALARVLARFFVAPRQARIAPTAIVSPTAKLGERVSVGHFSIIGDNVEIGDDTDIRDRVTIYDNTVIGQRAVIKAGAVIGEEGFGFEFDDERRPVRIPHLGRVVIGNDTEVGVNSIIVRGTMGETTLADRVKIDDKVLVAHNVSIGEDTLVTASAQISGSVKIGRGVWVGPNASIINGIEIGADTLIGIGAVVASSLPANQVASAFPARILRQRYPTPAPAPGAPPADSQKESGSEVKE